MDRCVTTRILTKDASGKEIPFEQTVLFLKRAGFEEADMSMELPFLLSIDWEEQLRYRLRTCEREQIRIRYAHMPYHYPAMEDTEGWKDFFTATCRAIDFARAAGADCAAIHPRSFTTRNYDPVAERSAALRFLEPYQDYALKKGFGLALENMRGPGKSADPALLRFGTDVSDVISLADGLNMGICWDTGHGHISGQDQYRAITDIGNRLKMVHLNDNFAEDDIHLAISLGEIPWMDVASGLAAIHYQGSLNTEVSCDRFPEPIRSLYAALMAESVRWLDRMIAEAQKNTITANTEERKQCP